MASLALLTRPREDCERMAALLAAEGIDCLIDPLLHIAPLPDAEERIAEHRAARIQALIATSRHALDALAAAPPRRSLPLFAVGAHTAERAKRHGFTAIYAAATVDALIARLRAALMPENGPLLYASGWHVSADVGAALAADGFEVRRAIVYEARAAAALSPSAVRALQEHKIAAAAFFSRRTLEIFERLAQSAQCAPHLAHITACCLSEPIATRARRMPWEAVSTAPDPGEAGMLRALREAVAARRE